MENRRLRGTTAAVQKAAQNRRNRDSYTKTLLTPNPFLSLRINLPPLAWPLRSRVVVTLVHQTLSSIQKKL